MQPVGDLLTAHPDAGIEMRVVPSLWPLHDLAMSGGWDVSSVRMRNVRMRNVRMRIVRMRNAQPRG